MIGQAPLAASGRQKNSRCLLQAADKNRALRSDDFCAHVISVDRLRMRLDVPNRAAPVRQVHHACHDIFKFRQFRPDRRRGIRVHGADFVLHHPTRQIEIMNRIRVKKHSVDARLVSRDRSGILIAPDRFENHRNANFAGFNSLHRRRISGVGAANETDLQSPRAHLQDSARAASRTAHLCLRGPPSRPPARETYPASRSARHPDLSAPASRPGCCTNSRSPVPPPPRARVPPTHPQSPPAALPEPAAADSPRAACPSPQRPALQLPVSACKLLPQLGPVIGSTLPPNGIGNSASNALQPPLPDL